jgi:hypothetical protein
LSILALVKLCGLLAAYLLCMLVLWLLVFDGIAARIVYSATPQISRLTSNHDTAFVFFTGTQSSSQTHSAQMRDLWSEHGDVVLVEYNPKRFDGPTITESTYDQLYLWGYRRVILDGASLGFMLSTDLIDYDRAHGNRLECAVMSEDGFGSTDDLVQGAQARAVAKIWHAGPVANFLLTRLFWKFGFNPPSRDKLGAGVDDDLLNEHYQASKTYPLSGWTGELRYIVKHRAYHAGEYAGIPIIIMRSRPEGRTDDDGVVKSSAADKIQVIFRGGTIIEVRGSTHVGFAEFVRLWRDAFTKGFAALPGW